MKLKNINKNVILNKKKQHVESKKQLNQLSEKVIVYSRQKRIIFCKKWRILQAMMVIKVFPLNLNLLILDNNKKVTNWISTANFCPCHD